MWPTGIRIESRSRLVHNGNNQFFQRKYLGRVPLMSLQPPQGKEVSRVCRYPFNLNISVSFRRRQKWKPLTRISTWSTSGALQTSWKGTSRTSPIASNLLRWDVLPSVNPTTLPVSPDWRFENLVSICLSFELKCEWWSVLKHSISETLFYKLVVKGRW